MGIKSRIIGTGSYLPEKIINNDEFASILDTSDEWITSRTGIKERHVATSDETSSVMAFYATEKAIASANINKEEIDFIIVATATPDMTFPSVACLLQKKLGIVGCPAVDMQAACTGFLYALATADSYIKSGLARCILVVGADRLSGILDYTDRSNCILFGDGAGAVLLQANDVGILGCELSADGSFADSLYCSGNIYKGKIDSDPYLRMDGGTVFKVASKALVNITNRLINKINISIDDIDWLVPHQANLRIIEMSSQMLNINLQKVIITINNHGNTAAASIPLALDVAVKDGRIKKNDNILLQGAGAGFSSGAIALVF